MINGALPAARQAAMLCVKASWLTSAMGFLK
jgi:hypothetical protein